MQSSSRTRRSPRIVRSRASSSSTATSLTLTALALAGIAVTGVFAANDTANKTGTMPSYDEDGKLLLPEDFRRWTLVGSSLGLSYTEAPSQHEMFHHTLMEPTAYDHFLSTGEFREGTMLALVLQDLGDNVLPGRQGQFAAELRAVELAVKDSRRVEESWAYYNFGSRTGLLDKATPFPKQACHDCHAEHAERDNVFLQFYSLLAAVAPPVPVAAATSTGSSRAVPIATPRETTTPEATEAAETSPLALDGLDPVHLVDGREELGKPEIVMSHGGYRYQFVSEPTRARFEADPERFSFHNESCVVVPGAPIDPSLFVVHDDKILGFATRACVESFRADPGSYVQTSD